jgi:hypothetical protein
MWEEERKVPGVAGILMLGAEETRLGIVSPRPKKPQSRRGRQRS